MIMPTVTCHLSNAGNLNRFNYHANHPHRVARLYTANNQLDYNNNVHSKSADLEVTTHKQVIERLNTKELNPYEYTDITLLFISIRTSKYKCCDLLSSIINYGYGFWEQSTFHL